MARPTASALIASRKADGAGTETIVASTFDAADASNANLRLCSTLTLALNITADLLCCSVVVVVFVVFALESTVTVTEAEPVTPWESVADAVTVWLPSESDAAVTEPPVPKAPSRDEAQLS